MGDRLIQVQTVALHGPPDPWSSARAAADLAGRAPEGAGDGELPACILLLLATADWCRAHPTLSAELRSRFCEQLGYEVPLIGGSMARIYCSTAAKPLIEHGVVLAAIFSKDIHVAVSSL